MSVPNQEPVHALSGAYALDALEDDEREAFELHLGRCPECQAEVASLREAAAVLAARTAVSPPPGLRERLLAEVGQVRPLPPRVEREKPVGPAAASGAAVLPFRRRLATRARLATAAAAVVTIGAVGIGVAQPWSGDSSSPDVVAQRVLAAPDAATVTQRFPDGSSAALTRSSDEGLAVIETSDMADPPSDLVFELWLLDDAGQATPAGILRAGGDNTVVLDGDASDAVAVAITTEPAGGSEQPTSAPIATFELEDV